MKTKELKKAQLGNLPGLVIGLVVIGIVIVVGFLIMSQIASNSQVVADGNATAAVDTVQAAMDDIPGWLGIIVVTIIGAFLIGLIVNLFRSK